MNNTGTGEFCWNELATPDVKVAKDFYGKVCNWEFTEHDMGDTTYTMITCNGKDFGGMWQIPKDNPDHIPPHWMGYILVDNVEETLEKAKKAGAKVKMPVTMAGNFGRFAIIIDPVGAPIAFWESLSSCATK